MHRSESLQIYYCLACSQLPGTYRILPMEAFSNATIISGHRIAYHKCNCEGSQVRVVGASVSELWEWVSQRCGNEHVGVESVNIAKGWKKCSELGELLCLVLATRPGNLPAVPVRTGKMVQVASRLVLGMVLGYPAAVCDGTGPAAPDWFWKSHRTEQPNDEQLQTRTSPNTVVFWPGFTFSRTSFSQTQNFSSK